MAQPLTGRDGYTMSCQTCDSTWAREPTQFKSLQLALPPTSTRNKHNRGAASAVIEVTV